MTKVAHAEDIGAGLEISGGKLNAAATMATDAEVAAAITAQDVAENAAEAVVKARELFAIRSQIGLQQNCTWELVGQKVKAHTVYPTEARFMTINAAKSPNTASNGNFYFYFPLAGETVKGLNAPDITVDSNGFVYLPTWGALWVKLPPASSPSAAPPVEWAYSTYFYGTDFEPSSDYIRILTLNHGIGSVGANTADGRILTQGLNYQDTGWGDLTPYFAAGVAAYGGGFAAPRFRRKNNRVYLEGVVTVPAPNYVGAIATLPNGFSPNAQHIFNVSVHGGAARVDAAISGAVVAITNPSAVQWLSLEGINFGLD